MRLIITKRSLYRLEDTLTSYEENLGIPSEKVEEIKDQLISKAKMLVQYPLQGQEEPSLSYLNKGYRRVIEGNFKIIYRVEAETIYVTDFFDTRQDPSKMKGE